MTEPEPLPTDWQCGTGDCNNPAVGLLPLPAAYPHGSRCITCLMHLHRIATPIYLHRAPNARARRTSRFTVQLKRYLGLPRSMIAVESCVRCGDTFNVANPPVPVFSGNTVLGEIRIICTKHLHN